MTISVKVIARAKQERVEQQSDGSYKAWVRAAREKGAANERLRIVVAEHFAKPVSAIQIVRGHTASHKIIEVS